MYIDLHPMLTTPVKYRVSLCCNNSGVMRLNPLWTTVCETVKEARSIKRQLQRQYG